MKKTPQRTCVICRNKFDKRELFRIVKDKENETVIFDKTGKANGRGAYVCTNKACIEKITNAKILNHALNMNLSNNDILSLKEEIEGYINK